MLKDPRSAGPRPPFPPQQQSAPGCTAKLDPVPDHGEASYHGSGKLNGCVALITSAGSGKPAELAPAYVFLASNDATYITGAILPVTGGKPML